MPYGAEFRLVLGVWVGKCSARNGVEALRHSSRSAYATFGAVAVARVMLRFDTEIARFPTYSLWKCWPLKLWNEFFDVAVWIEWTG